MNYGRYQIISELGRGAMGMVYQAHDPQINRMVALKVLREDRLTSEDYVQRFLKEATAIGRLSHPGIVTVYDVGQDHGTIYIAMEFLEGQPLDQLIKNGNINLRDTVTIGIQIAQALHYAHKRGIVHRDIKPPNIIFTPEMTIKVTDFGIAHIDDPDGQQMTRAGEILGTPVYMAPEQVTGQIVDGRSDLYSLGVILYELTTGRRPFRGENLTAVFRAITQDDPVPPNQLNPDIPSTFSDLILKTMAKKPEDRFASGQELSELLETCLDSPAQEPFLQTEIRTTSEIRRSSLPLILTTVFLFCGVGLVSFFYLWPPETADQQQPDDTIPMAQQNQENIPEYEKQTSDAKQIDSPLNPEKPLSPVSIVTDSNKIKNLIPPKKIPLPELSSVPVAVPLAVENKIPHQQAAESFDDLFNEDSGDQPITTPIDPTDGKHIQEIIPESQPKTDNVDTPTLLPASSEKTEITSLLPVVKEHQADIQGKLALLQMSSRPSGARLYIDGDYQGLTPIELEVTAMKHEVKLELQGHLDWQAQLNLSKGGNVPLSIPLLAE